MAPIKPPTEKLPLAVRKNVREYFDDRKEKFAVELSERLGATWKVEINPNAIFSYTTDGSWARESLGACLFAYLEGAESRIKDFLSSYGDLGKAELNAVAYKHAITMDIDAADKVPYCGVDIHEGAVRILFRDSNLGTNVSDALSALDEALNAAPAPPGVERPVLSFAARNSIVEGWNKGINAVKERIVKQLGNASIQFDPNWDDTFNKLKAASETRSDWERKLGEFTLDYFYGFAKYLESQNWGQDDMLKEGFGEAVSTGIVRFRIVQKLAKGSYNEPVVEDGALYLQTTPGNWGSNISDVAAGLVDLL